MLSQDAAGFENELITHTVYGVEVNGACRIQLQFLPQPQNVVIDRAGAGVVVIPPNLI